MYLLVISKQPYDFPTWLILVVQTIRCGVYSLKNYGQGLRCCVLVRIYITHIFQGYCTGTWKIDTISQIYWSNPSPFSDWYRIILQLLGQYHGSFFSGLLSSPGHQPPWYGLCRIHESLSCTRVDFNSPAPSQRSNMLKNWNQFLFPKTNLQHDKG